MRVFGEGNWILAILGAALKLAFTQAKAMAPIFDAKDPSLIIPGQYIVVLDPRGSASGSSSTDEEDDLHLDILGEHENWLISLLETNVQGNENKIQHKFNVEGLKGYTGRFDEQVITEIRRRPEVRYVEPDQVVYALDMVDGVSRRDLLTQQMKMALTQVPGIVTGRENPAKRKIGAVSNIIKQRGAPWGISRVCHTQRPFELSKYHYPRTAGKGVDVYVIDTGINIAHADFEGRAIWGATIPDGDIDIDGNGHGTHCAGTIASRTYGVAKKAHVIAVKVLRTNGFGTNADVIKGVEWTIKAAKKGVSKGRRSVANMSLGGGRSLTLEFAVNKAVKSGVHFSVAAGNDNEDACDYSPAAAKGPITVGASTNRDAMAFFSNHGPCVDIFGPGMDITSTWIGSRRAINTISGTSMASPHVAGVLALFLGEKEYEPAALKELLIKQANAGILEDVPESTENRLVCTRRLLEALIESKDKDV